MKLNDTDLQSFIEAYERDTGEQLSREEADEAAQRVLAFAELLATAPSRDTSAPAA